MWLKMHADELGKKKFHKMSFEISFYSRLIYPNKTSRNKTLLLLIKLNRLCDGKSWVSRSLLQCSLPANQSSTSLILPSEKPFDFPQFHFQSAEE